MTLLIDGYNLLHASGVFPSAAGAPTLERARLALLDYLVESLPARELARTTIAFDAVSAPPGLARQIVHRGLCAQFAERGHTADELLEELISAEPDPRHLLVVSSDHRVQRAARQRGAKYQDSEAWHAELVRRKSKLDSQQGPSATGESEKAALAGENPFPPGYAADLLE
jgi:predicted RNA-binding protein with PIN domain